jgi:hypothetical protein
MKSGSENTAKRCHAKFYFTDSFYFVRRFPGRRCGGMLDWGQADEDAFGKFGLAKSR